ncbi:MAG: hypothetical protein JWM80_4700 [Cyanobacteria bacterium RYN_339]|nr:hypothetical protein [Cyanobacteria bacterium RYN_339]
MPNPLTTIRKNGTVYTVLTPDEEGFLIGQSEGKPVAFFFSMKKFATAYLASIGKADHVIVKEDVRGLTEELIEAGVKEAFVDAEDPKQLPDPLVLPKYLEHMSKEAAAASS